MNTTTADHNNRLGHDDRQPLGFDKGCEICDKFWTVERAAYDATVALIEAAE